MLRKIMIMSTIVMGWSWLEMPAFGQSPSHAYINNMRSSSVSHYYVSIGTVGTFGRYGVRSENDIQDQSRETWQGYGIRNEIGIEFLKFVHFGIAHLSLNEEGQGASHGLMSGSRFEANTSLNFFSPLGNLQVGGGLLASRLDYRDRRTTGGYYGSGLFYNLGYDYFLTPTISFYLDGRKSNENLVRGSGDELLPKFFKTDMSEAGLGFKIWL